MSDFTEKQQKQIDRAKKVLQPGETVVDVTTGMIEVTRMGSKTSRNGAILVTDRRAAQRALITTRLRESGSYAAPLSNLTGASSRGVGLKVD